MKTVHLLAKSKAKNTPEFFLLRCSCQSRQQIIFFVGVIILYQGYINRFSLVKYHNSPPGAKKKKEKKSCAFSLSFIYQLSLITFHLDNFNMSEANNLANESHIAPCFPNDKWIYSSFVSPFPQFNDPSVDTANEYSNLIIGSYGQMQEYPIQGSSTELAQATGAHNSGDYTAQYIGSWKKGLVSPFANVWC